MVSHNVEVGLKAHQNWNIFGQEGGIELSASYSFDSCMTNKVDTERTETKTLKLDLGVPNYIYNKRVVIHF